MNVPCVIVGPLTNVAVKGALAEFLSFDKTFPATEAVPVALANTDV